MAITYDGTGGLFTRLGKIFQLKKVLNTFKSTIRTETDDISATFTDATAWQVSGLTSNRETFDGFFNTFDSLIDTAAHRVLIEAVGDGLDLQPASTQAALKLLIEDMRTTSTKTVGGSSVTQTVHVDDSTVSTTVAEISKTTNAGVMIATALMPMNQLGTSAQKNHQNAKVETLRVECVSDESNGRQAGNEVFVALGKKAVSPRNYEYPQGSSSSTRITVTSAGTTTPQKTKTGTNILSNSGFDNTTAAATFPNWTADSSRASGSFSQGGAPDSSNPIERMAVNFSPDGTYGIAFNGDGNEKHRIYQQFGTAKGTMGRVKPLRTYIFSVNIRAHADSGTISGGVLKFSLTDASYNAITTATTSHDLSSDNLAATWERVTGVWQTDADSITNDSRFTVEFTTALTDNKTLIMDELVLAEAVQLYPGGPSVLIVRGSADFRNQDRLTLAVANNLAGEMQNFFDQCFGTCQMNLNLPVAGTNRINDNLIG